MYRSIFENNDLKDTNNYNDEQLKFIKCPIENCKLLGIPGGGKTQSIIGKIIYHYSKNELNENNEFLILTFSRRCCNDFIEKGKKQNNILFNNKNILTLHSLSGKIIYEILQRKSSSQDTIIVSSIDLMNNYPDKIIDMPEFFNLKVIFVDEAQDISYIQYQFLLKIAKLTNSALILIGDPNQNIYQFQNGSDTYLINHPGITYSLIKNYRSTPHIVNFVNNFRPWATLTEKMISVKDENDKYNKKPVIFNGSIDDIIKDIINKILSSPFLKENIAIIGPVKKSKKYNNNISLSLFINFLDEHNIKYINHDENDVKKIPNHINLFTIHGSKGLEFDQVFLINFHTLTFGIKPTQETYKEFKYLWYVGLSRASYDLNIYIDKNKIPWNELKECPSDLYKVENISLQFIKELKFEEEVSPTYYSINEILNSDKISDLENIFKYEIETVSIFTQINNNYKSSAILYEIFIKNIFNFYYHKNFNIIPDFIVKLKKIINNTIIVPNDLITGYKILKNRYSFIGKRLIKLIDFSEIKNQFSKDEEYVYSFLCKRLNYNYYTEFFLDYEIKYSKEDLLESTHFLDSDSDKDIVNKIFKITLYYCQMSNLLDIDENINYYINEVIKFSKEITEKLNFNSLCKHPKLPIIGELDIISENKIINIIFSNNLTIKNILEILLQQHIINPTFDKDYQLEIWNFYLGDKYIIKINKSELNTYNLLKNLSKIINKKLENMVFFYHLETTGNAYTNKKIDIIDRHFQEYSTNIITSSGLLKPLNMPFIPFDILSKLEITKEMVYESGDNIDKFKKELNEMLEYCNQPIFISHTVNDNKFIFPYNKCKTIDSKNIIRLFLNDIISNKSLLEIFQYLFKTKFVSNRSIGNVNMLISIFKKLDIDENKILMKEKIDL